MLILQCLQQLVPLLLQIPPTHGFKAASNLLTPKKDTDSSSPPRRSSIMDATFSCTKRLSAILQSVPLCHSRSKRAKKASRKRATSKEKGLEEKHRRAKVARGKAKERRESKEKTARVRMRGKKKGKVTKRKR